MKITSGYLFKELEFAQPNTINFQANTDEYCINTQLFDKLNSINNDMEALQFLRTLDDTKTPIDKNGNHIIHIIARKGFYESLRQLLLNPRKADEIVNIRGANGITPLAVASNEKIARLLLSKGADLYALDDFMRPAGLNPVFPENIKKQIAQKVDAKIQDAKNKINVDKINTEPLQQTAAQNTYKKVEEQAKNETDSVNSAIKQKEENHTKSFFGIFKPQTEVDTVTIDNDKKVSDTKVELVQNNNDIKNKNTPIKKEKEQTENLPPKNAVSSQTKPKTVSEINIKGTESFKRIDTPAIQGLDDLVGINDIKNSLRVAIIKPVTDNTIQEGLKNNQTNIPNGILLVSPPGNGKTSLVKAIGAEALMPIFEIRDLNELERLVDTVGKNYQNTNQRAIAYIRGVDKLYDVQSNTGEITNLLDRVMSNSAEKGVLTVLSAECSANIPKTILTPGRIDRIFSFKAPTQSVRKEFITRYIQKKELLKEINTPHTINTLAERTQGFSIAQIKHIFDDAVINATAESKEKISLHYLSEKIKTFSKEQNIPELNEYNKTSIYDSTLRRYQPNEYDAENFESIAGMPTTKNSIYNTIIKPWKNADKLRAAKIQLPAGAIFTGDPGTSKTYMAKAIARSLNLPLYKLEMSNVGSSYVHETSKRIGAIIDQLITKFDETGEASILLMDEIDHFQKNNNNQAGAEEVNTLLQEIERGRNKILFIGTTNEVESLPDSLIRDGRMGVIIHFEHCDKDTAKAIMINMLNDRKKNTEVQKILKNKNLLNTFAERCKGMVASSVAAIINDALSESIINNTPLERCIDNTISLRRKKDIEKILSQNSKNSGHRLNITENSTIMYDTKYPRMYLSDSEPKGLYDLGGIQDVKKLLQEEIIDIYQPETLELIKENSLPITKGFILHGPSGNGKTTIIKAVANELKIPLYALNSGNIGSSFIHQLAKNAQEVRDQLAYKFKMTGERSLVFMDEAQQLVPRTSGSMTANSHNIEETNFFKDLIMTAEQDGIIYAMATNDLEQIEPSFYENADRLGVCVYIGNPDLESRIGIITKMLETRPIAKNINDKNLIKKLAEACEGFSISKISQTILNTIRISIRTKQPVSLDTALDVIKRMGGKL